MNGKKLGILAGVLFILIAAVLIGRKLSDTSGAGKEGTLFWPDFSMEECTEFVIRKGESGVTLEKAMNGWMVSEGTETGKDVGSVDLTGESSKNVSPSYPADSAKVVSALEIFEDMKRNIFISRNPEKHSIFEIDSNSVIVTFSSNESENTFYIGKRGNNYNSNYISIEGSDRVYDVQGGIKTALSPKLSRWQDKSITEFDSKLIKKITISSKDSGKCVIEKTTDTSSKVIWHVSGDAEGEGDKKKIKKIVSRVSSLKATGYETEYTIESPEAGIQKPSIRVDIGLTSGESKSILIGSQKGDTSKYFAAVPDREYLYLVTESHIKDLKTSAASLIQNSGS